MKHIIFPQNVFKVSDKTHYIYLAKKYIQEVKKRKCKFLNNFKKLQDVCLELTISPLEQLKKQIVLDFSEKYTNYALSKLNNVDLIVKIENHDLNIRAWEQEQKLKPLAINSLEILIEDGHCLKLHRNSINKTLNNVKNIVLHNVISLYKNAWDCDSKATITIKNDKNKPLKINPQVGINTTLNLENIHTAIIIWPLFNILFTPEDFYKGIDWLKILNEIILGPTYIFNKKMKMQLEDPVDFEDFHCFIPNPHNPLPEWQLYEKRSNSYAKIATKLKYNKDGLVQMPFRDIWLIYAKQQLKKNRYFSAKGEESKQRREILKLIVNIVEEANKLQNYNFTHLPSYHAFLEYIKKIGITSKYNKASYYDAWAKTNMKWRSLRAR